MASYSKENTENNIFIVKTENADNYTNYTIEVHIGSVHWQVSHRYSEFYELNEHLVAKHDVDKKLLPPKKAFGNTSEAFIQKRRAGLERYLQILIKQFDRLPFDLAAFLDFPKYEINGVTQILAETLFNRGDTLLEKDSTCSMDPLQLYAITERHTKPETVVSTHTRDIGHILDFVTRLTKLRVIGTDKLVGTSNINMNNLVYSLTMFKNIQYLELVKCNVKRINGLDHIRKNVRKLKLRKTLTSIQEFLTHSVIYWEDDEAEEGEASRPNIAWPQLTWVDMSENSITELPEAMRCLEKMEYLDLHDNYLESIVNLDGVSCLTHLDVSINRISCLDNLHLKLGNIKSINLSSNKLETLEAFSKLYSLEYLDVSNNQISQVVELNCLGALPLLESLIITGNPVTVIPDYRIQVLKIFGSRAKEVTLDNKKGTEKELDTVAVLLALDTAKQPANAKPLGVAAEPTFSTNAASAPEAAATGDPKEKQKVHELNTPALEEKLQVLKVKVDSGNSDGVTQRQTAASRFDSPFNSPTRSSAESEQQFHSLSSSPEGAERDGLVEDKSAADSHTADNLVADSHTADSLAADESVADNPTADNLVADESVAGDLSADNMVADKSVADNHIAENLVADISATDCRTPPDGAANIESEDTTIAGDLSSHTAEDNDGGSEISSPSATFSVNSDDGESNAESLVIEDNLANSSMPLMTAQGVEDSKEGFVPPSTPVNISIDVVDHLGQCLANVPNTLKLGYRLDKLIKMDGEELLNLFYHQSVIGRIGNSKEELCHVMWTSLVTYENPGAEQPCLVLLSNQATYFVQASEDEELYKTRSIGHESLKEVCVGPRQQSVRLGGECTNNYYCCITRDPQLVHVFVTRIAFIVDTDFAKPKCEADSASSDEESIYDKKSSEPAHPSGVKFIQRDDNSIDEIKFFLINECGADPSRLDFVEKYFMHLSTPEGLSPCTASLTSDALYFVQESYATIPLPECALEPAACPEYYLKHTVKLSDITDLAFHPKSLQVEIRVKEENRFLHFGSLTVAELFHDRLISISP